MIMNYKPCPTTCQEVKRKNGGAAAPRQAEFELRPGLIHQKKGFLAVAFHQIRQCDMVHYAGHRLLDLLPDLQRDALDGAAQHSLPSHSSPVQGSSRGRRISPTVYADGARVSR